MSGSARAAWPRRVAEEVAIVLLAAQFLTRLPVPGHVYRPERMPLIPRQFPTVGILVGAIAGLVYAVTAPWYGPVLAALLSTTATVLITGAFHEDGLADTCDGLGGGHTREQVLAIMRDSRLGTYGSLGLGLAIALKVATLSRLDPALVPWALLAGHAASRAAAVTVLARADYVRDEGSAKPVAQGIGRGGLSLALFIGTLALLALGLASDVVTVVAGVGGIAIAYVISVHVIERRLGGYTGDTLGAVQQLTELGAYLGIALLANA